MGHSYMGHNYIVPFNTPLLVLFLYKHYQVACARVMDMRMGMRVGVCAGICLMRVGVCAGICVMRVGVCVDPCPRRTVRHHVACACVRACGRATASSAPGGIAADGGPSPGHKYIGHDYMGHNYIGPLMAGLARAISI